MTSALVNIDVDDIERGITFYRQAFGWELGRRLGPRFQELFGAGLTVYLIQEPAGGPPAPGAAPRTYERHWTPVHLDLVVTDVEAAVARACAAGARLERGPVQEPYGRLAVLSDPFGHGFCFLQFEGAGYDAIATQ